MDNINYKKCKYLCYRKLCKYFYATEKKKFGYSDLSDYECVVSGKAKCPLFSTIYKCDKYRKKSLLQKIIERFYKRII